MNAFRFAIVRVFSQLIEQEQSRGLTECEARLVNRLTPTIQRYEAEEEVIPPPPAKIGPYLMTEGADEL